MNIGGSSFVDVYSSTARGGHMCEGGDGGFMVRRGGRNPPPSPWGPLGGPSQPSGCNQSQTPAEQRAYQMRCCRNPYVVWSDNRRTCEMRFSHPVPSSRLHPKSTCFWTFSPRWGRGNWTTVIVAVLGVCLEWIESLKSSWREH